MSEQFVDNEFMVDGEEVQRATIDDTKILHLVFRVEDEDYALSVLEVTDILTYQNQKVRRVPKTPNYLKGILNVRGDIIPLVCVRTKFMKPVKEADFETCILKVVYEDYTLGLIVDRVVGTEKIMPDQIKPPPNAKLSYSNQFIKSVGVVNDQVRMIISLEKLIF